MKPCERCKKRTAYKAVSGVNTFGLCESCVLCRSCLGRFVSSAESAYCDRCPCYVCGSVERTVTDHKEKWADTGLFKRVCWNDFIQKYPELICGLCHKQRTQVVVRISGKRPPTL